MPPSRLAERTKRVFWIHFITARVSGWVSTKLGRKTSGKFRLRSRWLALFLEQKKKKKKKREREREKKR